MAKKSKIVKNNKREETANFYSSKREELLAVIRDPESTYDEKREAQKKRLQRCLEMHPQHVIVIGAK